MNHDYAKPTYGRRGDGMRVHVLQHVYFEGLGCIGPWLEERGATVSWTRFHEQETLPELDGIDWVIALGGAMSVHDEAAHPWLVDEKRFIAQAIEHDRTVLGISLGAQLIAQALGAAVVPARAREIGWFPVFREGAKEALLNCPPEAEAFHWHNETFELPEGAVRLAHSKGCRNQAFRYGERVLALQFHLETTSNTASAIIANCRHELEPEPFVQDENTLRAVPMQHYANINAWMLRVLAALERASAR